MLYIGGCDQVESVAEGNVQMTKQNRFTGPIFIIGMPRSGTKLLRDLLNQNPGIGIPAAETHFIPHMIRRFGNPPRFDTDEELQYFYKEFTQTTFFWNMKGDGRVLKRDHLDTMEDKTSWKAIFEFISRFYAPEGRNAEFIWGDKTPGYLNYISLLKELYSEARFLHIIRDPRHYCLSVKKVWGKSIYRAAHRWKEGLGIAGANGGRLGKDYMEVHYESLLEDPEPVLRDICTFLGCEFVPAMTNLQKPSENLGDVRGQAEIVQDNKEKYPRELSPSEIKRIEEIAYPAMKLTSYKLTHNIES